MNLWLNEMFSYVIVIINKNCLKKKKDNKIDNY